MKKIIGSKSKKIELAISLAIGIIIFLLFYYPISCSWEIASLFALTVAYCLWCNFFSSRTIFDFSLRWEISNFIIGIILLIIGLIFVISRSKMIILGWPLLPIGTLLMLTGLHCAGIKQDNKADNDYAEFG